MCANHSISLEIEAHNRKYHSLSNKIAMFLGLSKAVYFPERLATSNYDGVPPEGITWEEACRVVNVTPFVYDVPLSHCPECTKLLVLYQSDWWEIDDGGQYAVTGQYCPEGHYTHLMWM